jgi:hypothetical protein
MRWLGTPGGIRTPDLEIRSLPLYPPELRARVRRRPARGHTLPAASKGCQWSGRRVSNPRHSAWKADALPTELRPLAGRADRIRTCDVLLPKQVRYQTAPRPVRPLPAAPLRGADQYRERRRARQTRRRRRRRAWTIRGGRMTGGPPDHAAPRTIRCRSPDPPEATLLWRCPDRTRCLDRRKRPWSRGSASSSCSPSWCSTSRRCSC